MTAAFDNAEGTWPYASPAEYSSLFSGASTMAAYPLEKSFLLCQQGRTKEIQILGPSAVQAIFDTPKTNATSAAPIAGSLLEALCAKTPAVDVTANLNRADATTSASSLIPDTPLATPQKRSTNEVGLVSSAQHKRQRAAADTSMSFKTPQRALFSRSAQSADVTFGNTSMDDSLSSFSPAIGILRMVDTSLIDTPVKESYSPRVLASAPAPSPRSAPCRAYAYDADGREHTIQASAGWPQFWPSHSQTQAHAVAQNLGQNQARAQPQAHGPNDIGAPRFSLWHR